jgi:hypothetical protein
MVIVHNSDNTIHVNNGFDIHEGLSIEARTVCTGEYTDYFITIPKDSKINKKNNEIKVRIKKVKQ